MATLTITLTEAVTLGDGSTDRGTTNIHTIDNVDVVSHRIMDINTSYVDVVRFGTVASAGTFKDDSVKYLRITNLHGSDAVTLKIQMTDSEYFVKLETEDHFLLGNNMMDAHEDGDTALGTTETLANIDKISAKASAAVQIEVFVAGFE
jgi:hypothetical protein